jgi:pyrimidine-nucleoside phosphorylase
MDSALSLIDKLGKELSEEAMATVVASSKTGSWGVDEMHRLADVLAGSGTKFGFADGTPVADVASTGAPTSLSTLLCPLYLRDFGFIVPKLGVQGRPAGGIDVLAQVSGYNVALDPAGVRRVLDQCGFAHFLAGPEFAPLDAALFRYRQRAGAQNIPALAVASILAKKIACGLNVAGLDVRVGPHGNFGTDFNTARDAARSFCLAAHASGIAAIAGLSDARTPYQPYIGRGESLLALRDIIESRGGAWLKEHADRCRLLATHVAALYHTSKVPTGDIATPFFDNLSAQGGSNEAFYERTDAIAREPTRDLLADRDGFLFLNLASLRSVIVAANSQETEGLQFSDNLGLILQHKPGAYVQRGDVLALVRARDAVWSEVANPLMNCFQVAYLLEYAPGMEEFIRA